MWDFRVRRLPSGSTVSYLDFEDGPYCFYVIHCYRGVHECRFEG